MNMKNKQELFEKINAFIKKYYQNQLIKGGIYVISILLIFFLVFAILEYLSSFGVAGRTFLFWAYILITFLILARLVFLPVLYLLKIRSPLTYKDAAKIIGNHFPEVDDKLLNLLELSEISSTDSDLISASIDQKTKHLSPVPFKNAIDFSINKKHLKWVSIPIIIVFLFVLSGKDYILMESSARIIKHNTFFEPKAPFNYIILNENLNCKQFDNFLLQIKVEGNAIPSEIFISSKKNNFKMQNLGNNNFKYLFKRVHSDIEFQFSAGGYMSSPYKITSLFQPKVVNMEIEILPPEHTQITPRIIKNTGDIIMCEGSLVSWNIELENSDSCFILINNVLTAKSNKKTVALKRKLFNNTNYSVISSNSNNLSDTLTYFIKTITDQAPEISLLQTYDTTNNIYLFNGIIQDDYLLQKLEFICSRDSNNTLTVTSEDIPIANKSFEQFFHTTSFNKFNLKPGEKINYYFKVWDNDGVNGPKYTNSNIFTYKEPSESELIEERNLTSEKTKQGLTKSILLAEEIKKEIAELNKQIINKKHIGWEEKKKAREILQKQSQLEKQITETQKKNSENIKAQEKLNSSTLEKQKELESLMNKVLDNEIKQILKEIEEVMENTDKEKLKDLLENLNNENFDLEKELNRELELFKQLEFEQKTVETLEKISELKEKQEALKQKTKEKKSNNNDLAKEQESLNNKMDEIKKDLEDLRQKNMNLEDRHELPKTQKLEEEILQKMQESKEALIKKAKKKSLKLQEDALSQIKKLQQQLDDMKNASAESKPIEDMETLRKILENLIRLSFDQEELIVQTKSTPQKSSQFVKLVQKQNKLSNDSKIIEDSLFALSKRVMQIESTINKEIVSINANMKKATKKLEERNTNQSTKRQQFVMTSTNNLALLLSEILEQMQKQLDSPPSECNKPKNCNKPNPNCNKPSMSELRKAQKKLNERMKKGEKGKKGEKKKQGNKKAKELMMLTKKQEEIRKQLTQIRDDIGKNGEKGKIDNIIKDMQKNEKDIINNRINQETINRQNEIFTKLLEAENADREKGKENKRESIEWGLNTENLNTKKINYQEQKKAQEELLKTMPVHLSPFYKKKVNLYFNSISND